MITIKSQWFAAQGKQEIVRHTVEDWVKLYHGDLDYVYPDNGLLPEMIAMMDIDEFAEDPDPDLENLKLRQTYLKLDHRISDITVPPLHPDEEEQGDNDRQKWQYNYDEDITWEFQPTFSHSADLPLDPDQDHGDSHAHGISPDSIEGAQDRANIKIDPSLNHPTVYAGNRETLRRTTGPQRGVLTEGEEEEEGRRRIEGGEEGGDRLRVSDPGPPVSSLPVTIPLTPTQIMDI